MFIIYLSGAENPTDKEYLKNKSRLIYYILIILETEGVLVAHDEL